MLVISVDDFKEGLTIPDLLFESLWQKRELHIDKKCSSGNDYVVLRSGCNKGRQFRWKAIKLSYASMCWQDRWRSLWDGREMRTVLVHRLWGCFWDGKDIFGYQRSEWKGVKKKWKRKRKLRTAFYGWKSKKNLLSELTIAITALFGSCQVM